MTKPGEKARRELTTGIPVKLTGIFKFLWNHGVPWRGGLRQTP